MRPGAPEAVTIPGADATPELGSRERILISMAASVGERGYRGATITDVVRRARLSKRTFYEEFDDKESCFLELYREIAVSLERVLREAIAGPGTLREQVRSGARAYYDALAAQPTLTKACYIEIATLSARATAVRRAAFDHFAAVLVDRVDAYRADHPEVLSRPLPNLMALAIMGALTEVLISRLERDQMEQSVDELVDLAEELVTRLVLESPPADGEA